MLALYVVSIVGTFAAYVYFCLRFVNVLEDELLLRHPHAKDRWKIKMCALHAVVILYWMGVVAVGILTWDPYPIPLNTYDLFK